MPLVTMGYLFNLYKYLRIVQAANWWYFSDLFPVVDISWKLSKETMHDMLKHIYSVWGEWGWRVGGGG